jgi:hypothetical protein
VRRAHRRDGRRVEPRPHHFGQTQGGELGQDLLEVGPCRARPRPTARPARAEAARGPPPPRGSERASGAAARRRRCGPASPVARPSRARRHVAAPPPAAARRPPRALRAPRAASPRRATNAAATSRRPHRAARPRHPLTLAPLTTPRRPPAFFAPPDPAARGRPAALARVGAAAPPSPATAFATGGLSVAARPPGDFVALAPSDATGAPRRPVDRWCTFDIARRDELTRRRPSRLAQKGARARHDVREA